MIRKTGWRLLWLFGFIPVAIPFLLCLIAVMMAAGVTWIFAGADERDGQGRLDRWVGSRFISRMESPADFLMKKAEVLREFWT